MTQAATKSSALTWSATTGTQYASDVDPDDFWWDPDPDLKQFSSKFLLEFFWVEICPKKNTVKGTVSQKKCVIKHIRGYLGKDYKAKMLQAILMTTFSSSLFVRQWVQAKEHKESLKYMSADV
jgi:hypothetical protein